MSYKLAYLKIKNDKEVLSKTLWHEQSYFASVKASQY